VAEDKNKPWLNHMTEQEKAYWRGLAYEYDAHLAEAARKHLTAARLGARKCLRCGHCCYSYPCTPRPDELEPIADYLGLSVRGLIDKYMVIDTPDCRTYFLRWAKHGEEDITGWRIPTKRTFDRGYCILFDKETKTCRIHPVRPREARYIKCWEKDNGKNQSHWGMNAWGERDIYIFVPEFNPYVIREKVPV
jgi:Fe-S-cluster containining protein